MASFRRFTAITFIVLCAAVVLWVVLVIGPFLLNPFSGFAGSEEFADLSGSSAKRKLGDAWPSSVDPGDVDSMSYKTERSRDSFSSWFRIKLTEPAAVSWADQLHAGQERCARSAVSDLHENIECVHRTVDGPPPLHWQTGETPAWWSPPSVPFRATEIMLWYKDNDSGVGRATYSAFDESSGVLWAYEYAAQHDKLWSPGEMPAELPDPKKETL